MKENNFFKNVLKTAGLVAVTAIPTKEAISQVAPIVSPVDTIRDKNILMKFKKNGLMPDYVLLTKEQQRKLSGVPELSAEESKKIDKELDEYAKSPEYKKYLEEEAKKSPEQKKKEDEEFEKEMKEWEKKYSTTSVVDSTYIPHYADKKNTPEQKSSQEKTYFFQGRWFIDCTELPVGHHTLEEVEKALKAKGKNNKVIIDGTLGKILE